MKSGLQLAIILAVAGLSTPAFGQSYLVHSYTVDGGLPSSTVYDIDQGSDGLMWFATDAGVVRYDGLDWDLVGSYPTLRFRSANFLAVDERNNAWVASDTEDQVAHFNGEFWARIQIPQTEPPIQILSIAAFWHGGTPVLALGTGHGGLFVRRGDVWLHYDNDSGLPGDRVRQVKAHGNAFVVVTDRGIAIWRAGVLDTGLNEHLPDTAQETLAVDVTGESPEDELWILSRNRVGVFRDGVYEALHSGAQFRSTLGRFVVSKDQRDFLYYGNADVLFQLNTRTGRVRQLGADRSLLNGGASDLLLDREHNLWIAGSRGVDKVGSTYFSSYRNAHGLLANEVTAITERAQGEMVLGHPNGISILVDDQVKTFPFGKGGDEPWKPPRVLDLHTAKDDKVWIAAEHMGLGILERDDRIRWFGPDDGVEGAICSVLEGPDGALFVLGQKNLLRYDDGRFEVVLRWHPEKDGWARRLFLGDKNVLFFGTNRGIFRMENNTVSLIPGLDSPRSADVFAALFDSRGRFWVGGMEGLFILENGRLIRPESPLPQLSRPVFFITEDREGEIWFGTENGVFRWDGNSIHHFTTSDGLAGRETNRDAGFLDRSGRMWIGTDGGVSFAAKEAVRLPIPSPQIDAARIVNAGEELSFTDPISLPHSNSGITFRFRLVSLSDEKRVQYRHRLEGMEREWSSVSPAYERKVQYTHLPPGRYRFHVMARNSRGTWSDPATSGWIVVRPPLWNSWWFLLMTLGGGGLIVSLVIISMIRARYATRLELEVARRTEELKESEELYHTLFEEDYPRLLIDPKTMRIADANLAGRRLTGLPEDRLVTCIAGLSGIEWLDRLTQEFPARLGPESWILSVPAVNGAGLLDLEIRSQPVSIQGEQRILVTAQDVTARRKLEDERLRASKLESVGLLAGGIAHDFNNLLTAILGNLSLARMDLAEGNDPDASLKAAEDASERAKKLTTQLLIFSRGGKPVRKLLNLEPLLRGSTDLALAGSNARCVFRIEEGLWSIKGDEAQLDQVFSNLTVNAVQAMPHGGVVTVSAENLAVGEDQDPALEAGSWVRITLSDEGVGIPVESIHQIFDPYFTTKETGSGIGLATCYSIITNHLGSIRAENLFQGGAQFTIYLPASPDESDDKATNGALRVSGPKMGPRKILVMDDEPAIQNFYERALGMLNHETQITGDGEEAVGAFQKALDAQQPFDVVILDLTVPGGMGGRESLVRLRKMAPGVRAIVASGYSNDPDMADYLRAGFQGALKKPFTIADLGVVLERVFRAGE